MIETLDTYFFIGLAFWIFVFILVLLDKKMWGGRLLNFLCRYILSPPYKQCPLCGNRIKGNKKGYSGGSPVYEFFCLHCGF